MALQIALVGPPRLLVDGERRVPRGRKAWAVLARALLSERPPSRRRLASELFPEADDPSAALRWTLAELRRALGVPSALRGDPVHADLPADAEIDVLLYRAGRCASLDLRGGSLLQGAEPTASPEFDSWLLVERQRVAGWVDAALREAVLQALALRDLDRAISLAREAVSRDPLDEARHVLLVRALAEAGQVAAARDQVLAAERLLAAELGRPSSASLRSAARTRADQPALGVTPRAAASSSLTAGKAALKAGAVDAGIECLRRAVVAAESAGDPDLHSSTLLSLGSALVHAVRGHDDEGSVLLHQALVVARDRGESHVVARALAELGYVDAVAGRRAPADVRLREALSWAEDDPGLLARIHGAAGVNLADWDRLPEAEERLVESVDLARSAGRPRQVVWSSAALGRARWLRGDTAGSRQALQSSIVGVAETGWMAYRPWPLAQLGELDLATGRDPGVVATEMEEAFALSCQLGDPCWEGATGRVLALALDAAGDDGALAWAAEARRHATRTLDRYAWMYGWALVTEAEIAQRHGEDHAARTAAASARDLGARAELPAVLSRALAVLAG
jgi:DNA-binding SARP family transcriptional activator